MSFTTKLAAGVMLAAATSTALTGCGKKSSTPTPSASMSHSMSSSMSSSPMATSSGYVMGTINGKSKHLRAGDQCQSKYASQYTQYGFTCAPKASGGANYYLTKN